MALTNAEKQTIISEYATHEGDTGSPEVQVALLTARINNLTVHMKQHKHDYHSDRRLLLMRRERRHLEYLRDKDINRYRSLIERLDSSLNFVPRYRAWALYV